MEPTEMLQVTLQAQQWNTIIAILHDSGPYKLVHPVLTNIMQQLQRYQQAASNGEAVIDTNVGSAVVN
ncbi:MAG TPA: hypothetical protein VGN34_33510 [Ktedonobacteraceae bacterium]|jgi:hypothetical protein